MVNSGSVVTATFATPGGVPDYAWAMAIAGVPGTAAPISLLFADTAGSATGHLLPTGNVCDLVDGVEVTCVDNGMPVVVARAADLGITGYESPAELAGNAELTERVQSLRLAAGQLMGLGDVTAASVPKTTLVALPVDGGTICTRTFIPVRPHTAIGVLGAVSAATALLLPGAAGAELAAVSGPGRPFDVEHPSGHLLVDVDIDTASHLPRVRGAASCGPPASSSTAPPFPASGSSTAPTTDRTELTMPLLHDVAHLSHAELLTPEPEKSLRFFTDVLGLTQNGTSGDLSTCAPGMTTSITA